MRLLVVLAALCSPVSAAEPPGGTLQASAGPDVGGEEAVLRRAARLVDRGLAYLAAHQNEDRSFGVAPGEEAKRAPLAVTAIAALAFMGNGSTLGSGPYRRHVRDAIEYLLDHQVPKPPPGEPLEGGMHYGYFVVDGDSTSKMHGHGFATLAVAQAYGTAYLDPTYGTSAGPKARADLERMRQALAASVRLIERSQSPVGGWTYEPYVPGHEGSMTVLMIQALRAARNVGVAVDKSVIDRAVRYVHRSQRKSDGAFRYMLNHHQVSYALTAAAVATLNASGTYDSDVIDLGIDYMRRHDPIIDGDRWEAASHFPYYARLYAAQAYFVYRDPRLFEEWFPRLVDLLENRQEEDGSLGESEYGSVYATAMSCLTLEVPLQILPIFQR